MQSKKISVIIVIVALCIGLNYALIGLPNFTLMDLFVFVAGFIFGPPVGAFVGILTWMIYGTINPYGFVPQIWLATMFSETLYGFAGGLIGKATASINFYGNIRSLSLFFAVTGFFSTFAYDLITNVAYASVYNQPITVAIAVGAPFMVIHEISNAALFGACSIPLVVTLERFIGGERFGVEK